MATKRKASGEDTHRSSSSWKRRKPNNTNGNGPPSSSRPNNHEGKKPFKPAHPVNNLKSTIRSIRRLLEHNDNLPAGVRIEKERELQTAQHELNKQQRAKKRSEMIGKWHKIRFFDRKKATRRLKRAKKELEQMEMEGGEGLEAARKKVEDCEVEIAYAMYYPLEKDYVPLWRKKGKNNGGEEDAEAGDGDFEERMADERMWERVKTCLLEGTLQDLREGRLGDGEANGRHENVKVDKIKKRKNRELSKASEGSKSRERAKKVATHEEAEESGDQSGGDFFE